jgi:hypothetical protein
MLTNWTTTSFLENTFPHGDKQSMLDQNDAKYGGRLSGRTPTNFLSTKRKG